jgi:nitroreductase
LEFNIGSGLALDQIPHGHQLLLLAETFPNLRGGATKRPEPRVRVGEEFFASRHSHRVYRPAAPDDDTVRSAVAIALTAPAVCNRQFGRIRVTRDPMFIRKILRRRGGARGFGDGIPALAIVTVGLRSYKGASERYQGWIDGGLFLMTFLLGIHSLGLGAITLNWSKTPPTDIRMRRMLGVPSSEQIIAIVGFGPVASDAVVASSPRPSAGACWVDLEFERPLMSVELGDSWPRRVPSPQTQAQDHGAPTANLVKIGAGLTSGRHPSGRSGSVRFRTWWIELGGSFREAGYPQDRFPRSGNGA